MGFFRGLGNRLRSLGADLISFLRGETYDFFTDEFPDAFANFAESVSDKLGGAFNPSRYAGLVSADPELSAMVSAALSDIPKVWWPLVAVTLPAQVLNVALSIATTPTMQRLVQQTVIDMMPEMVEAQVTNQLPWIPKQTEAQVKASLPFIPAQTNAQMAASLEWVTRQTQKQLEATLAVRPNGMQPSALADAVWRGFLSEGQAEELAARAGLPDGLVGPLAMAAQQPVAVVPLVNALWRGIIGPDDYSRFAQIAGYTSEAATLIERASRHYPSAQDLITFQAHEVYEPDAVAKYGLEDELELVLKEPFYKGGIFDEQIRNYWVSHWVHPSFTQIAEMLVRDILVDPALRDTIAPGSPEWEKLRSDEEREVYEWFRLVEIPPHWRDKLTKMVYTPYTRVDIRRMEDLSIVTDEAVFRNYLDLGYDGQHARNLTLWTRVYNQLPDLLKRYELGYVSSEGAFSELMSWGMPLDQATLLFERKLRKTAKPIRTATEKDLTKAEIVKGVKLGVLSPEQGAALLMGLGYDEDEASYIIFINTEYVGSPESYLEYRKGVEDYRKAQGEKHIEIPPDLIALEKEVTRLTKELEEATATNRPAAQRTNIEVELQKQRYLYEQRVKTLGL